MNAMFLPSRLWWLHSERRFCDHEVRNPVSAISGMELWAYAIQQVCKIPLPASLTWKGGIHMVRLLSGPVAQW